MKKATLQTLWLPPNFHYFRNRHNRPYLSPERFQKCIRTCWRNTMNCLRWGCLVQQEPILASRVLTLCRGNASQDVSQALSRTTTGTRASCTRVCATPSFGNHQMDREQISIGIAIGILDRIGSRLPVLRMVNYCQHCRE